MSDAPLESAYAGTGGVLQVFSAKAQDYARARPGYPAALYDAISGSARLQPSAHIVDLGAGTGLWTHGWLLRGYRVIAVEPNGPMRAQADAWLAGFANYCSSDGTAEATGLAAGSVDLATAAQAFHWFDPAAARAECLRILAPSGVVALVWNDRVAAAPLNAGLDRIFERFGGEQRAALLRTEVGRGGIATFFGAAAATELASDHVQALDLAELTRLVLSRSYMPCPGTAAADAAAQAVQELFAAHAAGGVVKLPYRSVAYVGRPA